MLREGGLPERLRRRGDMRDGGDLGCSKAAACAGRPVLNEEALGRMVTTTREAVALEPRRRPLAAARRGIAPSCSARSPRGRDHHRNPGLLLVDGHEDASPPKRSDTGEASDSEVGIALGCADGLPAPLDDLVPLLRPDAVAMPGPRDRDELDRAGVDSLEGAAALFRDDVAARASEVEASAHEAIATVARASDSYRLHIDLDVLRTDDFPAADYLQPGGLTWRELRDIATSALTDRRCFGCSVPSTFCMASRTVLSVGFGCSLQTRGLWCVSVALRFPGLHRESTGVWAPNGHPTWGLRRTRASIPRGARKTRGMPKRRFLRRRTEQR